MIIATFGRAKPEASCGLRPLRFENLSYPVRGIRHQIPRAFTTMSDGHPYCGSRPVSTFGNSPVQDFMKVTRSAFCSSVRFSFTTFLLS